MPIDVELSGSEPAPRAERLYEASLLQAADVAKILNVSIRTLWRLDSASQLPKSLTIGRSRRWRREEIVAWVNAGCPFRKNWNWSPLKVPSLPDRGRGDCHQDNSGNNAYHRGN